MSYIECSVSPTTTALKGRLLNAHFAAASPPPPPDPPFDMKSGGGGYFWWCGSKYLLILLVHIPPSPPPLPHSLQWSIRSDEVTYVFCKSTTFYNFGQSSLSCGSCADHKGLLFRQCFWASRIRIHHYLYGSESGSGSFHHQAKKGRKTLISTFL
jgi:hypothetical protein